MTDDLERRLRAADPTRSESVYQPADSLLQELSEAAMNSTTTRQNPRRQLWVPAVAAATAVAVLGVGAYALVTSDDKEAPPTAHPASMELTLPGAGVGALASCVGYSVRVLADMPTAFSGKAVHVGEDNVELEVDTWYRGGSEGIVELATADGGRVSLSDVVEFAEGKRYLVTASETGTVNSCGFTSEWSPEMAADFDRAFSN